MNENTIPIVRRIFKLAKESSGIARDAHKPIILDDERENMNDYQKSFFEYLGAVQEKTVQIALSKYKDGDNIEELLCNVTYDIVAELMTMIDGYTGFCDDKMDIVNCVTGKHLKDYPFIELHDKLADYLTY